MTLVIGRIFDNKIRVTSDSKIMDSTVVRNNPLLGNIKSIIINPQICLSFAGNVFFAEKLLQLYYSGKISKLDELIYECLKINRESNDETDFMIASLMNGERKLIKISGYQLYQGIQNAWIGDNIAFNNYQEHYHSDKSNNDEFSKMESALASVIKDEKIESVSDFQISVETVYHDNMKGYFFVYATKTSMSYAKQTFKVTNENFLVIPFGGPEIGAYGITYLRSIHILKPAIAIHFPQGKFGVLFYPQNSYNKAIIRKIEDGEEFIKEIKEEFGIPLEGLIAKNGDSLKYIINK